ncbi:hypothetical protein QTG56_23185 (plasmid) [Rossellomorea sp. AcN35-11]|nr:hypothetical protein [Rossellomorea aquimaris]WJV32271.1 hypothetical protein QTG56_23185 [Rossellomorea sp. AcN35-11]
MVPVFIAIGIFSIILYLLSFGFKRSNHEEELEEQIIRNTADIYKVKNRLKVLEEELLVEIEE